MKWSKTDQQRLYEKMCKLKRQKYLLLVSLTKLAVILYFVIYTSIIIHLHRFKMWVGYCDVSSKHETTITFGFLLPTLDKKRQKPKDPWKYKIPDSKIRTPRAVSVLVDPRLFVAVHMYVPVSSGLKSWIDNVPLLTLFRPFCKAEKGRVHWITGVGKPKASHVSFAVSPS